MLRGASGVWHLWRLRSWRAPERDWALRAEACGVGGVRAATPGHGVQARNSSTVCVCSWLLSPFRTHSPPPRIVPHLNLIWFLLFAPLLFNSQSTRAPLQIIAFHLFTFDRSAVANLISNIFISKCAAHQPLVAENADWKRTSQVYQGLIKIFPFDK